MEKLNKKFYPLALTYFRLLNLIKVEGSSQSENDVHDRIDSFGRKLFFLNVINQNIIMSYLQLTLHILMFVCIYIL